MLGGRKVCNRSKLCISDVSLILLAYARISETVSRYLSRLSNHPRRLRRTQKTRTDLINVHLETATRCTNLGLAQERFERSHRIYHGAACSMLREASAVEFEALATTDDLIALASCHHVVVGSKKT